MTTNFAKLYFATFLVACSTLLTTSKTLANSGAFKCIRRKLQAILGSTRHYTTLAGLVLKIVCV